jgi:hypothetical protein
MYLRRLVPMRWKVLRHGLWCAVLLSLLTACSGGEATPTLRPAAVSVVGSSTPGQSQPAATQVPAPNPPTQAPGATAIPQYGPEAYPENINPLTGEAVDPAKLNRVPVAVKISNFPYSVRPQFGLSLADLVFEHLAEAGLTRFTAIFLQNDAAKVGSIRSARYIDAEVAPMFQAVLVTSGSSLGTMGKLRNSEWFLSENVWRLVSEETRYTCPPLCREQPDDTNTLFTNTETIRQVTVDKGSQRRADLSGLAFSAAPPSGAPVIEFDLTYSLAAQVAWRYNADIGRYLRWQEKDSTGELVPHLDALTKLPIAATNVVLLQASHVNNFVPEDFRDGGNCGVEIQLWTSGPARVFRDGQMIEGRWLRDQSTNMHLRLLDNAGNAIPLKPGNTWFSLVTLNAVTVLNGQTFVVTNKVPDTKFGCPVPPTETPDPNATPTEAPTPTP